MREFKFRSYNKATEKMMPWEFISKVKNLHKLITLNHVEVMQFTGFKDSKGNDIYEGDILSDWTKTDEGLKQSFCQVFWNKPTGSWHLDLSDSQNKTYSIELWIELHDYRYKVNGNVYETITKERESSD